MKESRKKELIPFEKSKRVISLEPRGRKKYSMGQILTVIFACLAIASFLYCVVVACLTGTKFFLVWAAIAVFFGVLAYITPNNISTRITPLWLRVVCYGFLLAGMIFTFIMEGIIFTQFHAKASPGADYMIILGAQLKEGGPSRTLQERLDCASAYLQNNQQTIAIVSGGKGSDEPTSEAQGMKEYLVAAGMPEERIWLEDASTNTKENMQFSARLIMQAISNAEDGGATDADATEDNTEAIDVAENGTVDANVVVVTNNFHMYRALKIAKAQGFAHVEGLAARSYAILLPNDMLRECLAVVKNALYGNM